MIAVGDFEFTVIRSDNRRLHLLEMKIVSGTGDRT